MLKTEYFSTREDGVILDKTYSDAGFMIRQIETGLLYEEVIDPRSAGRQYEETDIKINDLVDYLKQYEERERQQDDNIETLTDCILEMSELIYS